MSISPRQRLPNRRLSHTETLEVDGHAFTATVGFDLEDGAPRARARPRLRNHCAPETGPPHHRNRARR